MSGIVLVVMVMVMVVVVFFPSMILCMVMRFITVMEGVSVS
jgi:hypothetical protein